MIQCGSSGLIYPSITVTELNENGTAVMRYFDNTKKELSIKHGTGILINTLKQAIFSHVYLVVMVPCHSSCSLTMEKPWLHDYW